MNTRKIGVCGPGGVGKTELAEALSKKLNIPLLKSREVTQEILNRDGYDYTSGIQIERFLANIGRQNEMLKRTLELQSVPSFVTDRTLIDLAAYATCELYNSDHNVLRNIIKECRDNVQAYTHIFFCPWKDVPVEDNNRRTLNPMYQHLIHMVELGIMADWGCSFVFLEEDGTDARLNTVMEKL